MSLAPTWLLARHAPDADLALEATAMALSRGPMWCSAAWAPWLCCTSGARVHCLGRTVVGTAGWCWQNFHCLVGVRLVPAVRPRDSSRPKPIRKSAF